MPKWVVPGYTELKPLGSGGFGAVLLARHDETGTPVAIKYLRPDLLHDPDFTAMFRSEAAVLGSLDDPYVVRLFEYVESTAGAAIVMELVDGVTLREILLRQGKTTPEAALVVLFGSLLGLAAAHARGVVHRDYKPANVLVSSSGASKLTDFGIAARAGTPGIPAASRNYAPPEQYDGTPASPAGDVYAATATFYECLTGHPPFAGQTDEALMEQHRSADVPMEAVPKPLQPLVARGMAKNPRYRPTDAAALAAELRTAATSAYGQDWAKRGRSKLGEAALLLAALWPSAGVPALQGVATEQVRLTQAVQHTRHPPLSQAERAARHRWHVLHLDHLRHLKYLRRLRAATAAVAAAAVVAAGVTVAVTDRSQPSTAPGAAGHPAVAAYPVPLTTIPLTTTSRLPVTDGDVYVLYNGGTASTAQLSGEIGNVPIGAVASLYAQQFPFTSAPVLAGSVTLNPAGGTAPYTFQVTPALATRYQVRLFNSVTATVPLAESAVTTLYVVETLAATPGGDACSGSSVCQKTFTETVYLPPSTIRTEMAKPWYVYVGSNQASGATPRFVALYPSAVVSGARQIAADAYTRTVSFSYNAGNGTGGFYHLLCFKDTEAQDGTGLPNARGCGDQRVPTGGYLG